MATTTSYAILLCIFWLVLGKVLDDGALRVHNAQGFWRPGPCASPVWSGTGYYQGTVAGFVGEALQ
eukprot:1077951-Rhodomonas_salina.1